MLHLKEETGGQPLKVLFLGDSITHDGRYIRYLSRYFHTLLPKSGYTFVNRGLSSETASGLSEPDHPFPRPCIHDRLEDILKEEKPDIVLFCYGMNDGIYMPLSEARFQSYKEGVLRLIARLRAFGIKKVVGMTPPPFDFATAAAKDWEGHSEEDAAYSYLRPYRHYDRVLEAYGDSILSLENPEPEEASEDNLLKSLDGVIDLRPSLKSLIEENRAKNTTYRYGDGIHPDSQGHFVISQAILKGLFNIHITRRPDFIEDPEGEKAFSEGTEAFKSGTLHHFYVSGREALVVVPERAEPNRRWIFRTEFFNAFPSVDDDLLDKGFHIAYIRVSDLFGSPRAVELMESFRKAAVDKFNLNPKAVLFGFSRGGLYACNYALRYPQFTGTIYLDAPVLKPQSWPGGLGKGSGSPIDWKLFKYAYGLSQEEAVSFSQSPLARVEELAHLNIPLALVAGDSDLPVPYEENGAHLAKEYKKRGAVLLEIIKRGCGHHPHSLEDPTPVSDFILTHYR